MGAGGLPGVGVGVGLRRAWVDAALPQTRSSAASNVQYPFFPNIAIAIQSRPATISNERKVANPLLFSRVAWRLACPRNSPKCKATDTKAPSALVSELEQHL